MYNVTITFNVNGQIISRNEKDITLLSDSIDLIRARFNFSPEWQRYTKTAIFKSSMKKSYSKLLVDDVCMVPPEAIKKSKYMSVSVFGVSGTQLITATDQIVPLTPSGYTDDSTLSPAPTENIYQQIVTLMQRQLECSKGPKGDKGDDGYTPVKDVDYFDGEKGPQGEQGIQGPKGDKGDIGDTGHDGAEGQPGTDGKSAYQYAVDGGYTGTEEEFAAKLAAEIPTSVGNDGWELVETITGDDSTTVWDKTLSTTNHVIVIINQTSQGAGYCAVGLNEIEWHSDNSIRIWNPTITNDRMVFDIYNKGGITVYYAGRYYAGRYEDGVQIHQ